MSDEVKELIEWLAKLLCDKEHPMVSDTVDHSFWEEKASDTYKGIWRNVAKEILSHPALALIDRELSCPDGTRHLWHQATDGQRRCMYCYTAWKDLPCPNSMQRVIMLAEAIEEAQDDSG